jgi:hypothetical protein
MTVYTSGYVFQDDGDVLNGATVQLLQVSDGAEEASTTTNSSGFWSFNETDEDRYDVKITSGTSIRFRKWADEISLKMVDARNNEGAGIPAGVFTNLTNSTSNQVAIFRGANTTRADNDEIYLSFELADSGGALDEFARITAVATDVTATEEDGALVFSVADHDNSGNLQEAFRISSSTGGTVSQTFTTDSVTFGTGGDVDVVINFNANTASGVLTWMEDEDYFKFSDDILMNSTEKILFGDTGTFIHQSSDGVLTIESDTTVDINGAVALNGAITGATDITLSGELDAATLDLSSSADIAGDLVLSGGADGALQFSNAGENSIKIPDNQASALIIEEANNAYITFVTTDSSEAITIAKATTFSNTLTVGVSDTGYDVQFFGATANTYMLWDENTDDLVLTLGAELYFYDAAGGEHIKSDGTDMTIYAGNDLNLTAVTDINIPSAVGLTFADDGQKIESDGTDLTIASGADLSLITTGVSLFGSSTPITMGGLVDGSSAGTPELQIAKTGGISSLLLSANNSGDGYSSTLAFLKSGSNTIGSFTTVVNNEDLGNIVWVAADGSDYNAVAARIFVEVDGAVEHTEAPLHSVPGRISFLTTTVGEASPSTRMQIKATGEIDFQSNSLGIHNVGASGNDWTSAALLHKGTSNSRFERTSTVLNAGRTALILQHTTNGDMTDGFGVFLDFHLEDDTASDANMGFIGMERAGADNKGMFTVTLNNAGSYDEVLRIDNVANVQINGSAEHASTKGTNILSLFNGTAPAGAITNGASFFCESGQMRVIQANGTATDVSPHNPETDEWWFNSKDVHGRVFRVHMERLMRRLDEMLGGGFIEEYIEV